eukprot:Skav221707  [mRNA]  locus=scaffold542:21946:22401:- [translate_table: standard]
MVWDGRCFWDENAVAKQPKSAASTRPSKWQGSLRFRPMAHTITVGGGELHVGQSLAQSTQLLFMIGSYWPDSRWPEGLVQRGSTWFWSGVAGDHDIPGVSRSSSAETSQERAILHRMAGKVVELRSELWACGSVCHRLMLSICVANFGAQF